MPSALYSWLTLSTASQQLANRLSDPNGIFWSPEERLFYIQTALRQYNSLTYKWKTDFAYSSDILWNSLATLPNSPRTRSVTDTYCYTMLEYMLLETPNGGGTWVGTTQFALTDLVQALQRRRDEMIQVSACNDALLAGITSTPNTSRVARIVLPDNVIDVPRVRFVPGGDISTFSYEVSTNISVGGSDTSVETLFAPFALTMVGVAAAGDVFSGFVVFQTDAKLVLSFCNSSLQTISTVDLSTVGSSVTAPAGTVYFMVSANNAVLGSQYDLVMQQNSEAIDYAVLPQGDLFQTAFSSSVGPVQLWPLGPAVSGTVIAFPNAPIGDLSLTFYDSNLAVIQANELTGVGSFTAPANTAFWSVLVGPNPQTSNLVGNYTVNNSASTTGITLYRDDTVASEFYEAPLYQLQASLPSTYSLSSEPPLSWQVDVPPSIAGSYEAIVLLAGNPFNPPTPSLINIPDDFLWVLMWGALGDLLGREDEAVDRERAEYCVKRYQQGLDLLTKSPWVMLGKVNQQAVSIDALAATDRYSPEWDSDPENFGPVLISVGIDFLAAPIHTGIGVTVLANAPIPQDPSDFVQVSRPDWDTVLDLAQSWACFKMGGEEWHQALEIEERAIRACAAENSRLQSQGCFSDILIQRGQAQDRNQERYSSARNDGKS